MYFSAEEGKLSIQELLDFLLKKTEKLYELNRIVDVGGLPTNFIKIGILRKS